MPKNTKYDVIIIGAGPAGLKCAEQLNNSHLSVLLIEKNKIIGPKICGGGLTSLVPKYDIPPVNVRKFTKQTLFLEDKENKMDLVNPIYTIDRLDFGQHLLKRIENSKNVSILKETSVQSISKSMVKTDNGDFYFRFLVGADGSNSVVRKFLDLETTQLFGIYCNVLKITDDLIWYFNPKLLREGYIWSFPHKDYTSIGVYYNSEYINHEDARKILREYLENSCYEYSEINFRGAPISCCYRGCIFDNIFLIGDAAGLASKMTGEGISYALISGNEIGKKLIDPQYSMVKLKKILTIKLIQKSLLKIFLLFNFASFIQHSLYKLLIYLLRNRLFQYLFGNRKLT